MTLLPALQPRIIDPKRTFENISDWVEQTVKKERAPGLIVGLSGTDSILTFIACYDALERLGKADRMLGLNFEHASKNEFDGKNQPFACIKNEFNWVAKDIFPWLRERTPQALLEIDGSIEHSDDNKRWGNLFSRALNSNNARHGLSSNHYFPVGTRNATEQALGTYTQISRSVSMLPIIDVYKSEVLELCEHLDVPQIAIEKSKEIDCDCGRFDIAANHIREIDLFLMYKKGLLSRQYLSDNIPESVLNAVIEFCTEERAINNFRERTPHKSQQDLVVTLP